MTKNEAIAFLTKRGYTIISRPNALHDIHKNGLKMINISDAFLIGQVLLLQKSEEEEKEGGKK